MKRISLLITLILAVNILFAQKAMRTDAFNNLRKGKLDKALSNIEPTIKDPSTMEDPKTWLYRGNIYLQIYRSDNPEYKSLDPDALNKAYESYQKLLELDTKKEYYTEALQNMLVIGEELYNQGVQQYSSKEFDQATQSFEKAVELNKSFGAIDTLAYFNAALSAENAGNLPKAIEYYTKVKDLNYPQPLLYNSLSSLYLQEGDTTAAINVIQEGKTKYPDDFNILIAETNIYLAVGDNEKAMNNLQEAIDKDPLNPTIHYAIGVNYSLINDLDNAEKSYINALDLNPEYFEANYNLGALYVNRAVKLTDEANVLPFSQQNEYEELIKQANEYLRKSLPYLEKAIELDPTDRNTLLSLKEIYTRLQMYDKMKEIDELLNN
ncbi:MAG: tetratricopeptide repeat protein [Lentimicrobiaceae bacterium]|nr:tetratricopeptide repeat protein [Lentimicrobiaceae bacterium]